MAKAHLLQRKGTAAFTSAHVRLYRLSRGRVGSTKDGNPILLLTTTGRKTGVQRTRPVIALPDGERFVVCGAYGGSDSTPAWALNLKANPTARVEIGGRTLQVRSAAAEGPEYDRLWTALVSRMPDFAGYRAKTSRRLPLLVLTPAE